MKPTHHTNDLDKQHIELSKEDEAFLDRLTDDDEGLITLVDKTQEICHLCAHLNDLGGKPSDALETLHLKLHEMVRRKINDGCLKFVMVDEHRVLTLASTDEAQLIAKVREEMVGYGLEDITNAPSTGTVQ